MGLDLGRMLLNIGFRAASGFIPGAALVRLTIEELGPEFCQAAWEKLKEWSQGDQRTALEQLGQIGIEEASALAEESLGQRADLSPELRAQAVQYLAAIPMSARRTLVQGGNAGASGLSLPAAQVPASPSELLRFLPLRPPLFRPGQQLAGHDWQLERLLGQGGFGEVWLAKNPRRPRQRPRALKFCLDEQMRQSLERETELLDRVEESRQHPGIVRLLETALSADPPFLAYEYVDGGDLTHWLGLQPPAGAPGTGAARPRPEPARVAALLLQIADALGFAHRLGLVHCDLKPSNVLIDRSGAAKLTDFGIGRVVAEAEMQRGQGSGNWRSATTQAQSVLQGACTPMYADRAQRRGQEVDARADIYAVGVMACQLLLGDIGVELSPYFREELEAAGVPADLISVVAGCLALPERRYADGAVLLAALEPVARSLGVFEARVPERREADIPERREAAVSEHREPAGPRSKAPLVIRTKRRTYSVADPVSSGPIADVFRATATEAGRETEVFLKIVRSPEDNEFLENEVRILKHLRADKHSEDFTAYLPEPTDSFRVSDPGSRTWLQATAAVPHEGRTTVQEILRAYPDGVDPRDMAWMGKRILGLTAVAHASGVIHGGLVPPFIGFDLENHDPFFADWPFAVLAKDRQPIQAMVPGYEEYYPPEILRKEVPTPATDIYMIGKCMIRLLGGRVETGELPSSVPAPLQRLLGASTIPEASRRLDDAWQLHQELDSQLERMFGPRKFRKFTLPRS